MKAYIFPGQGAQYTGMGKSLYDSNDAAKQLMHTANEILGFKLTHIMFEGTADELKQTNVTQPAIFVHSIAAYSTILNPTPAVVAGHSLGEFTALVANGVLTFETALKLVSIRANAMQAACQLVPSTMAAILNLDDATVENICAGIQATHNQVVVAANYNCTGQLVISGTVQGIELACEAAKAAGAKRALVLPVGGAFHSPLMQPAQDELATAIHSATFNTPTCPIVQNVVAAPVTDPQAIKLNLIAQLTGPVRWTQSIQAMAAMHVTEYIECGPGKVLQGLVSKTVKDAVVSGIS